MKYNSKLKALQEEQQKIYTTIDEKAQELHKTITHEYTQQMNIYMEKITLMITNTSEDLQELKKAVNSINEWLRGKGSA